MRVRKAVFPVGGWGTRFMPATKAIPKALFPIVDKPIIHYAVEEAVDSGIEQIIFVITPNNQAIEDYFSRSLDLESFLERKKRDYVSSFAISWIYAGLNDLDNAYLWIEKALNERYPPALYITYMSAFDPYRSDPRFKKLIDKLELPED